MKQSLEDQIAALKKQHRKPIPTEVRMAVLNRADYCCEDCGRKVPLEMHHLTYNPVNLEGAREYKLDVYIERDDKTVWIDDIFGHEDPSVLAALCRECHLARHVDLAGEFWGDPDEKEAYWWGFYRE